MMFKRKYWICAATWMFYLVACQTSKEYHYKNELYDYLAQMQVNLPETDNYLVLFPNNGCTPCLEEACWLVRGISDGAWTVVLVGKGKTGKLCINKMTEAKTKFMIYQDTTGLATGYQLALGPPLFSI
jgi:hypothetical protein